MEQLNAKQVEWLVINQPWTNHTMEDLNGECIEQISFWKADIEVSKDDCFKYYLTPETYNALSQEFKDLK